MHFVLCGEGNKFLDNTAIKFKTKIFYFIARENRLFKLHGYAVHQQYSAL